MSAISSFLFDILVIIIIIKTKQYKKLSTKLILCLSISDCVNAVIGQITFFIMGNCVSKEDTNIDDALNFVQYAILLESSYLVGLVAID